MIHFILQFLVCFIKPLPPLKNARKNKTNKVKITKKSTPDSAKRKSSKQKVDAPELKREAEDTKEVSDRNLDFIEISENVREWCHIEYCLLNEVLPVVEINVVTWGPAAKVFTADDCQAMKTVIIDDLIWVYFTVMHKIAYLTNDEVITLKNRQIVFKFSQNSTKMMENVRNDWPKRFTIYRNSKDTSSQADNWFCMLYQTDPPDPRPDLDNIHAEREENYRIFYPDKNSIGSMLKISPCEEIVRRKIEETVKKLALKLQEDLKRSAELKIERPKSKSRKRASKAGKKKIVTAVVSEGKDQLFLNGELLISGRSNLCVEQMDISSSLRYAAVIANSSKVLTEDQVNTFLPLIITVKGIDDLPLAFMENLKMKKVFCRYDLANVLQCVDTIRTPITGKDVTLDDTRVFFLGEDTEITKHKQFIERPCILRFLESLLTQRMVVRLLGEVHFEDKPPESNLFGECKTDPFIATPSHTMFLTFHPPAKPDTEIIIGSAGVNLIKLVENRQHVLETVAVFTSSPLISSESQVNVDRMSQLWTTEARDVFLSNITPKSHIPESVLLDYCTRVKIKVSFTRPLEFPTPYQQLNLPDIYHRLIVVFYNHTKAMEMFKFSKLINKQIINLIPLERSSLNSDSSNRGRYHASYSTPNTNSNKEILEESKTENGLLVETPLSIGTKYLSGFFVDNDQESILVLESIPHFFNDIVASLCTMSSTDIKVIYDSSLFFSRKLYSEFYPENVLWIPLDVPLEKLIQHCSLQDTPEQSLQALFLLDLLKRSITLNCACVNNLFPTPLQLYHFRDQFSPTLPILSSSASEMSQSTGRP